MRFVLLSMLSFAAAAFAQSTDARDARPLAGMANDAFFVRSPDDAFQLFLTGRGQFDAFLFQGGGPRAPSSGFVVRRARVELQGVLHRHFEFQLAGEWSGSPILTDAYAVYSPHPLFRLQLGQFDAPFTMENRTSDKWFDFMERSLTVRSFGYPDNKAVGAMLWGNLPHRLVYYSIGLFNGDGQNQRNLDKFADVIGRAFVRPLSGMDSPLRKLQIGGSFQDGFRKGLRTAIPSLTSQGGVAFFNTNAGGTQVFADGGVRRYAAELWAPIDRLDLKFELVRADQSAAEVAGGALHRNTRLEGTSFYVQAGYWISGNPGIVGEPGIQDPPRLDFNDPKVLMGGKREPALFAALRFENTRADYSSLDAGVADRGQPAGSYGVSSLGLGLNYWATKHVRVSVNGLYYWVADKASTYRADGTHFEVFTRLGVAL